MRTTYKYRLMPKKTVEHTLHWVLARCRELYNAGLSDCGAVRKKTLEERWHSCACGCELDRDTASAKVVLDVGHQILLGGARPTRATA